MDTTPNLGLKKPAYTDPRDVADVNYNADILDSVFTGFTPGQELPDVAKTGDYSDLINAPVINQDTGSSETDLMSQKAITDALSGKQDTLTAGENISIDDNVISASGGDSDGGGIVPTELDDIQMEAKIVQTTTDWTPVTFYRTFIAPPCVIGSTSENYIVSVQNVTQTGCEVAAKNSSGTFNAASVNLVAIYDGGTK